MFLTLQAPFHAITATTVASILEDVIEGAGLGGQGFSAKSFKPTGVTGGIGSGQSPDIVMKMGRWKTASVFYGHCVHAHKPDDFTGEIIIGKIEVPLYICVICLY